MTIRYWISEGQGFDLPAQVVDLLHRVLQNYPRWWGEYYVYPDDDAETAGDVIAHIWLDERDYNAHYGADIVVLLGRWIYHHRFGGWWYYYDLSKIERRLKRGLESLGKVEARVTQMS